MLGNTTYKGVHQYGKRPRPSKPTTQYTVGQSGRHSVQVVATKSGELGREDRLLRRIDGADCYVALEDLALSHQCGFASILDGNRLLKDEQRQRASGSYY